MRRVFELVGSEGRVSAGTLERVESDTVTEFCDSNNRRVVLLDEFPKTYVLLV